MCGIYASIGFEPDTARIDIVAHRGPDGRGWKTFDSAAGPVALGHRRLAIIDLDVRAAQPMPTPDDRYWLVYNGEIYNYLELREELAAKGVTFRTTSDSEVLLAGYAQWGERVLDRLLGMFTILIWDQKEQRLFAARDRFGIKPLYFVANAHGVALGSEIKQLMGLPGVAAAINVARAYDFLSAGYTDHSDETMFADVRQLRGGECVTFDLARWRPGAEPPVRRWYDIPREAGPALSESAAAARFRELFFDSVRLHLRSDVRVGSCLSGGLDSSSIVAAMDRLLKDGGGADPVHTISACYAAKEVDEKPFMEAVVAATRTTPHYIYPDPETAFAAAEKITWHQDEPYGSTSIYSQWCVFEEAKKQAVKVMLDGQGADEQLAGYHGGFWYHQQALLRAGDLPGLARLVIDRRRWHGLGLADQATQILGPRAPAWLKNAARRAVAPSAAGDQWLSSAMMSEAAKGGGALAGVLERDALPQIGDIGELCLAFVKGASLPMLLRYEDRNSMAHSIEARVPFLDHRLVEFNLRLWDRHKIVGGDTKRVLRSAMYGVLPEMVRERRDKLGFATPEQRWFRGPLRPLVEQGVRETMGRYPDLLNRPQVEAYMKAALDGDRPVDFTLWRIVNFGLWGRVFGLSL